MEVWSATSAKTERDGLSWKRGAQGPKVAASGLMSPAYTTIDPGDISPGPRQFHYPAERRGNAGARLPLPFSPRAGRRWPKAG